MRRGLRYQRWRYVQLIKCRRRRGPGILLLRCSQAQEAFQKKCSPIMALAVKPMSFGAPGSTNKSMSQPSLKSQDSPAAQETIEVFPPEVTFKDIETEQTYEVTICIRNLSPLVRRVRFTPPKTSRFAAAYDTGGPLAVGMALNVVVTFETNELGDFHDELLVRAEGLNTPIVVPLHALQPRAEVFFDPFVNMGFTVIGKPQAGAVLFRNEGSQKGEVRISYDKAVTPELTVIPESFSLPAGGQIEVALSYVSKEVSTFRCVLEVSVEGQDLIRHIDVNANCVEQQIVLVASSLEQMQEGEEASSGHMAVTSAINFGSMYHGQTRTVQAYLVNVGPFPSHYSVRFVQGAEDEVDSEGYMLMTPQEFAAQSIKRAIDASPLTGEVPPFSQVPILFTCLSKKQDKTRGFIHDMMEERNTAEEINSSQVVDNEATYFYTALFAFAEVETKLAVQLQARAIFPNVILSHTSIHFHECAVNEHKDFLLNMENRNEELPLDFEFSPTAHFGIEPVKGVLLPQQAKSVVVTFKPANLGEFEACSQLCFIKGAYKVPIKFYGSAARQAVRVTRKRGPDCLPRDFAPSRRFAVQEEGKAAAPWMQETFPTQVVDLSREADTAIMKQHVKQHYNNYLQESRKQRARTAQAQRPRPNFEDYEKNVDLSLSTAPPRSRKLQLPSRPEALAPPLRVSMLQVTNFDPDKPAKNSIRRLGIGTKMEEIPFNVKPERQQEIKECSQTLGPLELEKIAAGPKELHYDQIVIRSEVNKWFSVTNGLQQHISVELSSTAEEIPRISPASLVIPPGQRGGFCITVLSTRKHKLSRTVKYVINGRHEFYFLVLAEVQPALLELALPDPSISTSTQSLFLNFKFEEDNMEESLMKQVLVLNRSPASGRFTWQLPADTNFEVDPLDDVVDAFKQKTVQIRFIPGRSPGKFEEETLIMKVENGETQSLTVKGEVSEARCSFQQKHLDFGTVAVGIKMEKVVIIRNSDLKPAVFHVKRVPGQLTVTPMKGKIASEGKFPLKLALTSLQQEEINGELEVQVRGGKGLLRLVIRATALVPNVYIQEPDIDFAGVTVGSTVQRRFTLVNESPIAAVLYLNLEEHPEFEISLPEDDGDAESGILVPASTDRESPFYLQEEEDLDDPKPDPLMDEEESAEEEEEEVHRKFKLTLQPSKSLSLSLHFAPKDTEPYQFTLPLLLAGINASIPGIVRTVHGEGLKPRFLVEPATMRFKNKVISREKNFPALDTMILSNPGVFPTAWRIDATALDYKGIFSIKPTEGTVEPGNFANIRVGFNPVEAIEYEEKANLYLDGSSDPYMTLTFQGEGTVPKITFDRREVILPIVPLNIPAKTTFYVVNGGYDNVEVRFTIPQDAGNLQLTLELPDGKQLGVTKQRIRAEVTFLSSHPISFTTRLDFLDTEGNRYSIPLSGTAENSLLTAFPFIQRNSEEVKFEVGDNGAVQLVQEVESETELASEKGKSGGFRTSGGSSVVSRSAKSIIGFNPIPQINLEKSLEFLARWFNHNTLSSPVNKLPDDFIAAHGAQVYEIIHSLTGKSPPGQVKNHSLPARELTKQLLIQYTELLTYLKTNGALLNTIRPEYLLSLQDFSRYLKTSPGLQLKPRQVERRWPYLSMDAWITLLYQIVRVFLLNRLTPKTFRSLPGMPPDKAIVDSSMTSSNIYSTSENIILRWLSYHYNAINPASPRHLTNFDQDLMDGCVVGAVVQNHVGQVGALARLKQSPGSDEQRRSNVDKVFTALSEIGMPTFLNQRDLAQAAISPREMVLFCLSLYQGLPHYIPKTIIEFPCTLGETVIKNLELTNPSSKQITYWVKLEGCLDFVPTFPSEFTIAPRGVAQFPIRFTSRLSSQVRATLRFTSRASEGSAHAAAMVFTLISKVTTRKSEKTLNFEAHLYELKTEEIEIANTFAKDAEFAIQIIYPDKPLPPPPPRGALKPKKSIPTEAPIVFPKPFFLKNERVKVKKNSMNTISLVFMPFNTEQSEAYLVFTDNAVGEMQYTIVGSVLMPKVDKSDRVDTKGEVGEPLVIPFPVNARNHQFERAKAEATQRLGGAARAKERDLLREIFKALAQEDCSSFTVELSSPFFSGPSSFTLADAGRGSKGKAPDASQVSIVDASSRDLDMKGGKKQQQSLTSATSLTEKTNQLQLTLNPRQPGEYSCLITLTNPKRTDIRSLEVVAQVKPKKAKMSLEMTAHAREVVTQEIPIVNNSDKEWQVKVRLTQDGDSFSVSKDFIVRKKTTGECVVSFKPEWVCEARARLDLDIPASGETYEFEIIGHCGEPRAEANLTFQCRVKERSHHTIPVINPRPLPVLYRVVSDLMNATGDSNFEVPANSTSNYELSLYPLQSGTYTGSVTFYDSQNRFYWYTIEVQAQSPEPESAKTLRVHCRKALEFKVTVYNPMETETTFSVNITGEGLTGPQEFTVAAKETQAYTLLYMPLQPGESEGSIAFLSDHTGEFWYKLKLVSDPAEPIEPELFSCDLGKSQSRPFVLENPSATEVILDYACTNPLNYELIPDKVILPPFGSVDVLIKYTPATLKSMEIGEIRLTSSSVGDWVFLVKGKGLPPSEMETIVVTSSVGESNSLQIPFKNPFRDTSSVTLSLETSYPDVFQLLLRRAKFSVGPLGVLLIPVAFQPKSMQECEAKLVVAMSEDLVWRYPVRGVAERPSNKVDFVFRTKCRTVLEKEISIVLQDLGSLPEEENFSHELQPSRTELIALVGKSFHLFPLRNILANPADPLIFKVRFEPLKPFKTEAELFIYKGSGGRWRYNIVIEAKEPDPDDTIVIEAQIHKPANVAFRLANHVKQYAAFEAFFTPESDPFFGVQPAKGLLDPHGREGTQFIVSFTPVEYGAPKAGTLVIQTEDMQWTYLVKGTHPHYSRPEVSGGRIDNHLPRSVLQSAHPSHKNFIKTNITDSRRSPLKTAIGATRSHLPARPSSTK